MKITIIAVSVSALSQIQIFQKEYAKKYPEDAIDFAVFYVAGMENKYLMHPEILENAVREADVAVIDLMGGAEGGFRGAAGDCQTWAGELPGTTDCDW